jgi:type II secretory pathway pseudopilin PulG
MIQFLKRASNNSGMGLAETMMAFALSALVAVSVLTFAQNSFQAQRTLKATQGFNDYVSASQMALDDMRACTYNFGYIDATTPGIPVPDVGSEVPIEILQFDANNPTQPRADAKRIEKDDAGRDADQTITKVVKLRTMAMTAPGHYIGRIIVTGTKTGEFMGGQQMTQGFPIFMITDDTNTIVSCYGNFASGGLSDLQQKQCEVLVGPTYFWNPKTDRCESRYETICNPGSRTTSTCPSTTLGLAAPSCSASGYIDGGVLVPPTRTYTSGTVRTGIVPGAYACMGLDKYTVQCDYADGVDSTGATCSSCCNVERKDVQQAGPGAI